MMVDNRPDLPALEKVEVRAFWLLWVYGFCLALALFVPAIILLMMFRMGWPMIPEVRHALYMCLPMLLPVVWVVVRVLLADFHWRSDEQGLYCRGMLRKRFIPWPQVTETSAPNGLLGQPSFVVRTERTYVQIPVKSGLKFGRYENDHIAASAWQHIRRVGTARALKMPEDCESFWDRIPDAVPVEINWSKPGRTPVWAYYIFPCVLAAVAVGCFIGARWNLALPIMGIPYVVLFLTLGRGSIEEARTCARSVLAREDWIEAELPGRTVQLAWSAVTEVARAGAYNGNGSVLVIRGRSEAEVIRVPIRWQSEESSKLFLAIVRRARTAGIPQAIAIPVFLRSQGTLSGRATAGAPDTAELRMRWWEVLAAGLPAAAFLWMPAMVYFGLTTKSQTPDSSFAGSLIGAYLLGVICLCTYRWRVDAYGVSKRLLFWAKSVRWEQVASYRVYSPTGEAMNKPKSRLLSDSGRVLLDVTPDMGSQEDRKRFLECVEANLMGHCTNALDGAEWKSRPWESEG